MNDRTDSLSEIDGRSLESRWERALIIISLPHGAAFGAFYGKYDFAVLGAASQLYCVAMMMALLPLTAVWLFLIHDLLRNVFLRQGHMGLWLKVKYSILFTCAFFGPMVLLLLLGWEASKGNKVAILGLLWVMFSWVFCAVCVSNSMYLNAAKALRIKVDD